MKHALSIRKTADDWYRHVVTVNVDESRFYARFMHAK